MPEAETPGECGPRELNGERGSTAPTPRLRLFCGLQHVGLAEGDGARQGRGAQRAPGQAVRRRSSRCACKRLRGTAACPGLG